MTDWATTAPSAWTTSETNNIQIALLVLKCIPMETDACLMRDTEIISIMTDIGEWAELINNN